MSIGCKPFLYASLNTPRTEAVSCVSIELIIISNSFVLNFPSIPYRSSTVDFFPKVLKVCSKRLIPSLKDPSENVAIVLRTSESRFIFSFFPIF